MDGGKDRKRETGKWEDRKGQMNRKQGEKGSVRDGWRKGKSEEEGKRGCGTGKQLIGHW
jgi:hypothetical protein